KLFSFLQEGELKVAVNSNKKWESFQKTACICAKRVLVLVRLNEYSMIKEFAAASSFSCI
ncbi:MAG: hypothetical protein LUH19_00915, partial [Lachnospiraceae bacterium]|nr:hypothetical protein [Lachnospiraceae bacterium]